MLFQSPSCHRRQFCSEQLGSEACIEMLVKRGESEHLNTLITEGEEG